MIKKSLIYTVLLLVTGSLISCKFTPYSGNDFYNKKASVPLDEAPHYKNSLEWWYFTGHLKDKNSDKEYGIEYVFFHFNPRNKNDYMMVNVAITDKAEEKFYYAYEIAKLDSLLEPDLPINLSMVKDDTLWTLTGQEGVYLLDAFMNEANSGINLRTRPVKPVLLHNNTGYEQYGEYTSAGYLSYPRLQADGALLIDGKNVEVEGELWYDRQWNCIGVYTQDVAWDWFSIQFDNTNEELMLYQLYNVNDDKFVYGGSLFTASGEFKDVPGEIELVPVEYWVSPDSKVSYPVKWNIKIPEWDMDLTAKAVLPEQELRIKFNAFVSLYYWEGMCEVEGNFGERMVTGDSYIEMTNRGVVPIPQSLTAK